MSAVLPMVKETQTSGGTTSFTGCAAVTNFFRGDTAPGGAINRRYKAWVIEGSTYMWGIGYKSATGTFVMETVLGNNSGTTSAPTFTSAAIIISMAHPGVDGVTFPAVYSEDGDGVCLVCPCTNRPTDTNNAFAADTLYVQEGLWSGQSPVVEMGLDLISNPGASGTVYIGAYEINSVGEVGEVLFETSIAYTTASIGLITAAVSGAPLTRYCYVGVCATSALTVRAFTAGQPVLMGVLGSSTDSPGSMLSAAISSPTALPDPAPTAWGHTLISDALNPWALYWG